MLGFLNRLFSRAPHPSRSMPGDGRRGDRSEGLPAAIARTRARRCLAGAPARRTRDRAFWITVDPQDLRRTVMAGTPVEVCAVLDELMAMDASAAHLRGPAFGGARF